MDKDNRTYLPGMEEEHSAGKSTTEDLQHNNVIPVLLMGLDTGKYDAERSMAELASLAEANGMESVAEVLQKRDKPASGTVLGAGRLAEARLIAQNLGAEIAIFDGELSGSQIRNLEEHLKIPVLDRTLLILEIFKNRATTREGKTQTELATLEYRLPRLAGLGSSLSRQGGGGGGGGGARRGGGETKLEYDRRYIRSRIAMLKKRLAEMETRRQAGRRTREKRGVPIIALVGYTNVGKSSLVNALTGSDIPAKDMLFATLDPTARHIELPDGQNAVLVDTVGFVSRLPHNLVEAFKSTLEEAAYADLIIKVCDVADPEASEQLRVTEEVLADLKVTAPSITVYNKADKVPATTMYDSSALQVSAKTGEGLPELLAAISGALSHRVRHINVLLPYDRLALADTIRSFGTVLEEDFRDDGVFYSATVEAEKAHLFTEYLQPTPQQKAPEDT